MSVPYLSAYVITQALNYCLSRNQVLPLPITRTAFTQALKYCLSRNQVLPTQVTQALKDCLCRYQVLPTPITQALKYCLSRNLPCLSGESSSPDKQVSRF